LRAAAGRVPYAQSGASVLTGKFAHQPGAERLRKVPIEEGDSGCEIILRAVCEFAKKHLAISLGLAHALRR